MNDRFIHTEYEQYQMPAAAEQKAGYPKRTAKAQSKRGRIFARRDATPSLAQKCWRTDGPVCWFRYADSV